MTETTQNAALHTRLKKFATTRSLSDIARNTDTPFSTVHRFLNGGRVTAEFCTALIREYGLNASWLMLGDGPMFPEAVPTDADENATAGNILELVSAMNAVSRVRLGALDGRHHARMLKELSEALGRYETLRQDLNRRSGKVMQRLLDALEDALESMQREKVDDLARSVEQVHRLCDDESLERRYLSLRAHSAFLERNPEEAQIYERKLIRNSLAEGRVADSEDYRHIARLALNLFWCGQAEQAQRICDAALILAGEEGDDSEHFGFLGFIASSIHVDRSDLRGGLAIMPKWRDLCTGGNANGMRTYIGMMQLMSGEIDAKKVAKLAGRTESTAINLLEYAFWSEDIADFELAINLMREQESPRFPDSPVTLDLALLMQKALTRKRTDVVKGLKFIDEKHKNWSDTDPSKAAFFGSSILARFDKKKEAKRYAKPCIPGLDADGDLTQLYRAILSRTLLRLYSGTRTEQKRVKCARDFFAHAIDAGFEIYRPWFESWVAKQKKS